MPRKVFPKLRRRNVPILLALAWLTYRGLTGGLTYTTRLPEYWNGTPAKSDPVKGLLADAASLREKRSESTAAIADLENADGLSRLPAAATPTIPFSKIKAHCPSLKALRGNTWLEIDETGQLLSAIPESGSDNLVTLSSDCRFEPYLAPGGRPLAIRTLYVAGR